MLLNDTNKMIVTNKVEITVIIYKVNWGIMGVLIRGKRMCQDYFFVKKKIVTMPWNK